MNEYSSSKAIYHLDKIKDLQSHNPIVPTELQVDLMAWCNHNCNFCSYRKDNGFNNDMLKLIGAVPGEKYEDNKPIGKPLESSMLPLEFARTLPKQMFDTGIPAIELTGGGEPTLWPAFDELIENLAKYHREIALVTNGSSLSDTRIELLKQHCLWIRISMDASNQITHKKVHRTQGDEFERIISNIMKLCHNKRKDLIIGISFIINPDNISDIEDSIILYKSLGVDNIRFSWMYDAGGKSGLMDAEIDNLKSRLDFYKGKYDTDVFKVIYDKTRIDSYSEPNDFDKCYFQRFVWSIGADAKLYPCCINKYDAKYVIADLKEKTIGEVIYDISTQIKMDNLDPHGCTPCWLRTKNYSIVDAVEEPKHKNFI